MLVISLGETLDKNQNNPTYETPELSKIAQSGKSSKDDSERNLSKSVDISLNESFGNPNNCCYCSPSKNCNNCEE